MNKHETKYFGEIELSVEQDGSFADFDTMYNGKEITVSLSDYKIYGDKLNLCWGIIDKYIEINEIAKNAIIEYFDKNENIHPLAELT